MGGVISLGPSSLSERKRKLRDKQGEERKRKQSQEDEARRRLLLEQHGVLIPPVFLANKTDDQPLSSRVWERFFRESSEAQPWRQQQQQRGSDLLPWAYRRTKHTSDDASDDDFDAGPLLGQTLLTEYMTPGLFLSLPIVSSGANDGGRFLAALTQQPFSKDANSNDSLTLPSFLSLTKCFHRNSSLFFPFPWKVETFLPQHALLATPSSSSGHLANGIVPSSVRFIADLSSPSSNNNRTQVSWTTHFLDQDYSSNSRSIGGLSAPSLPLSPLWTRLKGSWIEAETVRPDFWKSGITLRMASAMTLDCFLDHVVLESCRFGNDALERSSGSSNTTNAFGDFLRKNRKQKSKEDRNLQDETIRVRLAAEYKESILASSTNISLSSLLGRGNGSIPVLTVTDTLLSLNLNGGESDQANHQKLSTPPPLWLTLKQSKGYAHSAPSSFALNLSQVVTFDREIWNILEDRAPKIRNHVGWVCQIERLLNHDSGNQSADGESTTTSASILSIGASAQFNRNIAAKVILESKLGSTSSASSSTTASATAPPQQLPSSSPSAALKFAFVFKRWLEPQASLSVIQKVDLLTGKWSFLGVGLEIEQQQRRHASIGGSGSARAQQPSGKGDAAAISKRDAEYRDTADMDSTTSVAPPTRVRVELPGGKR